MYQSIEQWMHDPDFVFHISIAQQLGKEALPQAIRRFKEEHVGHLEAWKAGEQMGVEEKIVLVRKLKMSSNYIGAKRLQQFAVSFEQPLAAGVDQPLDPMMSCLEEILTKLEHL